MDISSIISHFSQEESSAFKNYLRAKNKRADTKNIALYEALRKGNQTDKLDIMLYGKENRNAYYALSKRLQDNLIDFIATRSFETETSEDMQVFKWILTARILYEQNQCKTAQKILAKATNKAKELDLYTALTESYHTQLQYHHLHPEVDLTALTQNAQNNLQRFMQQEQLNIAYAHIKRALIFDEQLLKTGIQKTVEDILNSFKVKLDEYFGFKSLFQLLEIMNTAANLDHNFGEALPFITKIYLLVRKKSSIQHKQRFYHIQVLYFMANAHFRVRDFRQAHTYLDEMETEMNVENGKWESRFRENFLLIHSFLLNYTGQSELAIASIESHLVSTKKRKAAPDLTLAYVVFLVQQESFKKAHTAVNSLKHTDRWYENLYGTDWVIKKELLTLIIYYELEYIDLVTTHLRSFKRKYKPILKIEVRLERFISIFTQMFNNPACVREENFRESVKTSFTTENRDQEDLFMLSFFGWIKSKLDQKPLYVTTLALIKKDRPAQVP